MKEIYDINIQRMNNGAHFTFVSNILGCRQRRGRSLENFTEKSLD